MSQELRFVELNMKLHLDITAYKLAIQCLGINDAISHGKVITGDLKTEMIRLLSVELLNLEGRLSEIKNATH
jgi:hypothetical protein